MSPHGGPAVCAGTRRDLRYLFTEYLLLEHRYLKEMLMEYYADGLDAPDDIVGPYEAVTAELVRRAELYQRTNDRSWPNASGKWYESLLEQARTLKSIWPIDKFLTVVVGMQLHGRGPELSAGCPFHQSKSGASFKVSTEKDVWHCFGCGKGGDLFQLVGEYFGIDAFPEQVGKVADITSSMMTSVRAAGDAYEQTQRDLEAAVHQ